MGLVEKYRPKLFSEFWGNYTIIQRVKQILSSDDIPHAFLITGPFGIGKTSLARLMAKALNCSEFVKNQEICPQCKDLVSEDIIEIDGASYRGINEIKKIKEFVVYRPLFLKRKVIIIDEAHQLTNEAVSSLLKILEELPDYCFFIFVSVEKHKIIPTLLSRLFVFELQFPTIQTIRNFIEFINKNEGKSIDFESCKFISFRDFLKMVEGSDIIEKKDVCYGKIVDWFLKGDFEQLSIELQQIAKMEGIIDYKSLLQEIIDKGIKKNIFSELSLFLLVNIMLNIDKSYNLTLYDIELLLKSIIYLNLKLNK